MACGGQGLDVSVCGTYKSYKSLADFTVLGFAAWSFLELDDLFHKFGLEGLFLYSGFRSFDTINLNLYNL